MASAKRAPDSVAQGDARPAKRAKPDEVEEGELSTSGNRSAGSATSGSALATPASASNGSGTIALSSYQKGRPGLDRTGPALSMLTSAVKAAGAPSVPQAARTTSTKMPFAASKPMPFASKASAAPVRTDAGPSDQQSRREDAREHSPYERRRDRDERETRRDEYDRHDRRDSHERRDDDRGRRDREYDDRHRREDRERHRDDRDRRDEPPRERQSVGAALGLPPKPLAPTSTTSGTPDAKTVAAAAAAAHQQRKAEAGRRTSDSPGKRESQELEPGQTLETSKPISPAPGLPPRPSVSRPGGPAVARPSDGKMPGERRNPLDPAPEEASRPSATRSAFEVVDSRDRPREEHRYSDQTRGNGPVSYAGNPGNGHATYAGDGRELSLPQRPQPRQAMPVPSPGYPGYPSGLPYAHPTEMSGYYSQPMPYAPVPYQQYAGPSLSQPSYRERAVTPPKARRLRPTPIPANLPDTTTRLEPNNKLLFSRMSRPFRQRSGTVAPKGKPTADRVFVGCSEHDDVYEITTKLGEGTFGIVTKARIKKGKHASVEQSQQPGFDGPHEGQEVAIKRIIFHQENDGMPITALRELRILKGLRHHAIVPLLEMAVKGGNAATNLRSDVHMVFPYMDHDLAGLLENKSVGQLSQPQVKLYSRQLLEGVHYLHQNDIIHRDMKAANLLINNKGELKIADFGLARNIHYRLGAREYTQMVVTRWYRPPELLLGEKKYGKPVDIWGVGCVIAEMFKGHPIFPGMSDVDQCKRIFDLCGTPTMPAREEGKPRMPGWQELPGLEGLNMAEVRPHEDNFVWVEPYKSLGEEFVWLMRGMLHLDPYRRLRAQEALKETWFWTEPLPMQPRDVPSYPASHEYSHRSSRNTTISNFLKEKPITHEVFANRQRQAQGQGQAPQPRRTGFPSERQYQQHQPPQNGMHYSQQPSIPRPSRMPDQPRAGDGDVSLNY